MPVVRVLSRRTPQWVGKRNSPDVERSVAPLLHHARGEAVNEATKETLNQAERARNKETADELVEHAGEQAISRYFISLQGFRTNHQRI